MAKRAFSRKSWPTWGPDHFHPPDFPGGARRRFERLGDPALEALPGGHRLVGADQELVVFSFAEGLQPSRPLDPRVSQSPAWMSAAATGSGNLTWMRVPPAKSMPKRGPLWMIREVMLIGDHDDGKRKANAILRLPMKSILTPGLINCMGFALRKRGGVSDPVRIGAERTGSPIRCSGF